jgi:hypothetical protein
VHLLLKPVRTSVNVYPIFQPLTAQAVFPRTHPFLFPHNAGRQQSPVSVLPVPPFEGCRDSVNNTGHGAPTRPASSTAGHVRTHASVPPFRLELTLQCCNPTDTKEGESAPEEHPSKSLSRRNLPIRTRTTHQNLRVYTALFRKSTTISLCSAARWVSIWSGR